MKNAQEMWAIAVQANAQRPVSDRLQAAIEQAAHNGDTCANINDFFITAEERKTLKALGYQIRDNSGDFSGTVTIFWS